MNAGMKRASLLVLQWILGLTVLIEALLLAFSAGAIHAFAKTGMHDHIRLVLAWGEIAGAILFLIPPTVIAGGWILCVVFVLAAVVHVLHGWWDVGMLIVYTAAAIAVVANRAEKSGGQTR